MFCIIDYADLSGKTALISGSIANPFISHSNCLGDKRLASAEWRGHLKCPDSIRLVKRRKPSPSQTSPLILLARMPQKRKRVPGTKSGRWYLASMIAARESMPYRILVRPQTMYIAAKDLGLASLSITHLLRRMLSYPSFGGTRCMTHRLNDAGYQLVTCSWTNFDVDITYRDTDCTFFSVGYLLDLGCTSCASWVLGQLGMTPDLKWVHLMRIQWERYQEEWT